MTRKVTLTFCGIQSNQGGKNSERVETVSQGEYFKRNGKHYIIFEESVEGIDEKVKSKLKFDADTVEVSRSGQMNSHMVFQENKKNLTGYNTPFGQILMGIDTKKIQIIEREDCITVDVDYSLDANDEFLSDCHMEIVISPAI